VERVYRYAVAVRQFQHWRVLWALAVLGAVAVGIAAPGDDGFP
jgi:hypothetical protein